MLKEGIETPLSVKEEGVYVQPFQRYVVDIELSMSKVFDHLSTTFVNYSQNIS